MDSRAGDTGWVHRGEFSFRGTIELRLDLSLSRKFHFQGILRMRQCNHGTTGCVEMMKVSLCLSSGREGCKTVSSSYLNEKVARMCMSCRNCVWECTKGQVNTASTSHQEEQKLTRNKARQARYSRIRLLFLIPSHTCAETRALICSRKQKKQWL